MTYQGHAVVAKLEARKKRKSKKEQYWDKLLLVRDREKLLLKAKKIIRHHAIPSSKRKDAWFKLLGAEDAQQRHEWLFEFLVKVDSTVHAERIDRDINRTFGKINLSDEKRQQLQVSLRRILLSYSNLDFELGYCQGMNFIAAYMMHYFKTEDEAFWMFVAVFRRIRCLFIHGLVGFYKCVNIFDDLLVLFLPDLKAHFDSEGVLSQMYLTGWFHTFFTQCAPSFTARVWDNFFIYGFEFIIRICLAIVTSVEPSLHGKNVIQTVCILKEPPVSNPQKLIDLAFTFDIPENIQSRFKELDEIYPLKNFFGNLCWFHEKSDQQSSKI